MQYTQHTSQAPSVAQALALGQDVISNKKPSYDQDSDIRFEDVVREQDAAQKAREREELKADLAKEEADNDRDDFAVDDTKKADSSRDEKNTEDTKASSDTQDTSKTAATDNESEANDPATAQAHNDNSVDASSTTDNAILQFSQLPQAVQDFLKGLSLNKAAEQQTLAVDMSAFAKLSDTEKAQALSFLSTSNVQDIYGLYTDGASPISSIDDFMARLKQQSGQNNPAALLSNLTPQQVTAIENYLAQQPTQKAGREVLNSILALQNIDPDTALSRGGPGGALAGLSKGEIIEHALNSGVMDDIAAILKDMAQIVKPRAQTAATATNLQAQAAAGQQTGSTQNDQQQAARLNNLVTAAGANAGETAAINEDGVPLIGGDPEANAEFERLMSRFTSGEFKGYVANTSSTAGSQGATQAANASASNQASANPTPLLPIAGLEGQSSVLSVADSILQELGLNGTLVNTVPTQASGLTNVTTASQTAGQAHPAVHTVAATLHKSANGGVNKAITLRLDPPELGRVEVKMSFDNDSKIKAVLTAERPETHLMMQRDQSVLERALQDAGFDTDGALQFELAQDGHDFNQDGGHDQFHQGQSGAQTPEDEVETIDTTMTWAVDSATGHVSYNLLV